MSALFFVNAALYANLVPRLPEVKERLALGNAALGSAIAAMPVGALLAGLCAPALIQRLTGALARIEARLAATAPNVGDGAGGHCPDRIEPGG